MRGNLQLVSEPGYRERSIPACAGEPVVGGLIAGLVGVYPRVCGGTSCVVWWVRRLGGLSPRVRGNQPTPASAPKTMWSIPACAGEPSPDPHRETPQTVYPRVCGGTQIGIPRVHTRRGLSPRVRGNPQAAFHIRNEQRSIPACAGEPTGELKFQQQRRVYPRVCGGTRMATLSLVRCVGLSPRVRGNPSHPGCRHSAGWSIPACAGEPFLLLLRPRLQTVYPRVCGGTGPRRFQEPSACGLSPRVRGNQIPYRILPLSSGSIPACAGEPIDAWHPYTPPMVYPRVCGGTLRPLANILYLLGLSPRVRGNRLVRIELCRHRRSIPACAGEPRPENSAPARHPVYPRVCGGTRRRSSNVWSGRGLSPRVRGNLW